jgi:hypothetical protein
LEEDKKHVSNEKFDVVILLERKVALSGWDLETILEG